MNTPSISVSLNPPKIIGQNFKFRLHYFWRWIRPLSYGGPLPIFSMVHQSLSLVKHETINPRLKIYDAVFHVDGNFISVKGHVIGHVIWEKTPRD